jgi:hypothetical protein
MTTGATDEAIRRRRLRSQLLSGPRAVSPEEVVGHLLAVQAQDGRGFRPVAAPAGVRIRTGSRPGPRTSALC